MKKKANYLFFVSSALTSILYFILLYLISFYFITLDFHIEFYVILSYFIYREFKGSSGSEIRNKIIRQDYNTEQTISTSYLTSNLISAPTLLALSSRSILTRTFRCLCIVVGEVGADIEFEVRYEVEMVCSVL